MIERKTLMSLGFLEKQNLTGSYQGMRYLLKKQKEEDDPYRTAFEQARNSEGGEPVNDE